MDFSNGTNTDIALVRYNPDGSLDTSLDTDGIEIIAVGSGNDNARAIAVQSDGKILIAGSAYNGADSEFALVRYNQDGSLDTVFDGDGIATTAIGGTYDYAYAIAVQSDARIIAAGYSDTGTGSDVVLVRYWP